MSVRIEHVRAEDLQQGDIERHESTTSGRRSEWNRVQSVEASPNSANRVRIIYESGTPRMVRRLDLVEVQRDA